MPRQRTLAELLEDARVYADVPVFSTTTRPTKVQATRLVNRSLYRFRQKHRAAGTRFKTATIAVVSGDTSADLPSDFAALDDQYLRFTEDGIRRTMVPGTMLDIDRDGDDPVGWAEGKAYYLIRGRKLLFNDPLASYTLSIGYVPETEAFDDADDSAIGDLVDDADYIYSEGGIDDWVALDVAATIAGTIEERDNTAILVELQRIEDDLEDSIRERDDGRVMTVQDTWRSDDY